MSQLSQVDVEVTDAISSVRFSPSGNLLAIGSWDKSVNILTRNNSDPSAPFTHITTIQAASPVLDLCWGRDDAKIFIVGLDHAVYVQQFDPITAEATASLALLSSHTEPSNKVAYSPNHDLLISTSWDKSLIVNALTLGYSMTIPLPAKPYALSLNADKVVIAMAERKVYVYALALLAQTVAEGGANENEEENPTPEPQPWQQRESSLKFMTRSLACMPNGEGFATSSIEGRVGVEWFDPDRQGDMYAFKCHRQTQTVQGEDGGEQKEVDIVYPVNALAFHPVHGTFATGGGDGVVACWDATTKRRVRQYPKLGASVAALDFSPDGKFMAVGVSPGFEDGEEDAEMDRQLIKVFVRQLEENETKGKPVKDKS